MCEIEPASGLVCLEEQDFSLNGDNPFFFTRRYNNHSRYEGPFGLGWMHPYDVHLTIYKDQISLVDAEGRIVLLPGLAETGKTNLPAEELRAEFEDGRYVLHQPEGKMLTFSAEPLPDGQLPLLQVDQTDENSVFLSYWNGQVSELRTTSNHQLRFDYRNGRISRIGIVVNRQSIPLVTYTYDANGQLTVAYDSTNRPTEYSYSNNLLTQVTNRQGGSFYLQYDRYRRATAVWQEGFSRMRRIYYDDRRRSRVLTDSMGHANVLRYNENGLLVETVLPKGLCIGRSYADGNEPIEVSGLGPQPIAKYDPKRDVIEEADPDGCILGLKYDPCGRVIEETNPDGGITRYEYDKNNRIVREVEPTGAITTAEFDESGNLVQQVQPLGNIVRATRHESGFMELHDSLGQVYASEHDGFGNTTKIVAPSGNTSQFEYDLTGNMTLTAS
jgi:YD repeat-containing protein